MYHSLIMPLLKDVCMSSFLVACIAAMNILIQASLEEGMAAHASILSWRIYMDRGSHRVRHDRMTKHVT